MKDAGLQCKMKTTIHLLWNKLLCKSQIRRKKRNQGSRGKNNERNEF